MPLSSNNSVCVLWVLVLCASLVCFSWYALPPLLSACFGVLFLFPALHALSLRLLLLCPRTAGRWLVALAGLAATCTPCEIMNSRSCVKRAGLKLEPTTTQTTQ